MQVLDSPAAISVTPDVRPVICDSAPPKRLEELMREACAVRHYSRRTFQAYWHWSKRFILWAGKRHPRDMGQAEVAAFLSHLATAGRVSASTQRQALHGILFLYQQTLGIEIGWVDDIVRAKQPQRLPTVLSTSETAAVLAATSGTPGLFLRRRCTSATAATAASTTATPPWPRPWVSFGAATWSRLNEA